MKMVYYILYLIYYYIIIIIFKLDPSDLKRIVQARRNDLSEIYSKFLRRLCDFGEETIPADLCRVTCTTCGFKVYLWIHFCEGTYCKECRSKKDIDKIVIGCCKSCEEALTECRKCLHRCQQCKCYLCLECSCGEFCRTIGRTLCQKCAGNKYDHLLSRHQLCDY